MIDLSKQLKNRNFIRTCSVSYTSKDDKKTYQKEKYIKIKLEFYSNKDTPINQSVKLG